VSDLYEIDLQIGAVMRGRITRMRVNDMRPSKIMKGQIRCIEKDRRRLLSFKSQFANVVCPACQGRKSKVTFLKNRLTYVKCVDCETVYVNPRPTPEILAECYSKSSVYEYWNKYVYPVVDKARRENMYRPRVNRIIDMCVKNKIGNCTLVEVGAGFGSFCDEAQKSGFFKRVIGVEPTPDGAESCRNKNVEVMQEPVEKILNFMKKVDVVASFEVIEHLFSPKLFLNHCSKILRKGGLIVLSCPNIKGFDNVTLGKKSSTMDHEHLNYFNPKSLNFLLSSCGFRVLEISTPGKLDAEIVRNNILEGNFSIRNKPFLRQILVDEWEDKGDKFQDFLADNLLSGHMWAVASKK
jgi:2-polyprenyl-3-methyl-5-hydroxy-6-metoxy-1,4-benzoquinol methylase/ribosomal protein S27E